MKTKTKKRLAVLGGVALAGAIGVVGYVFGHKPAVVENPCWRTFYRADGVPKKAFDAAWKANWQTVKQFIFHGEICKSYQAGIKFFTGHSKEALIKSINIFK